MLVRVRDGRLRADHRADTGSDRQAGKPLVVNRPARWCERPTSRPAPPREPTMHRTSRNAGVGSIRRRLPSLAAASAGALLVLLGVPVPAFAAGGGLDTSFGGDGKVTTNFTPRFDAASSVAATRGGKLVAVGLAGLGGSNPSFALVRYNHDGSLDSTFGGDGRVTTNFTGEADAASAVVVQCDGKIVAAGGAGFSDTDFDTVMAVARYDIDGSLDTSFGGDGRVTTDLTSTYDQANAIALQDDGKIVVAGYADAAGSTPKFGLVRYKTDGSLDRSFGSRGKVLTSVGYGAAAFGVAVQRDGKIVVSGETLIGESDTAFALVRYKSDGSLDKTFGGNGKVTTNFTSGADANNAVAIQADGEIVASGGANAGPHSVFALARYDTDGTLDPSFGRHGKVTTAFTRHGDFAEEGLCIQPDGKIVAAGVAGAEGVNPTFAIARYDADGSLDASFGGDGRVSTDITGRSDDAIGLVVEADGRIVAAGNAGEFGEGGGNARFALARYLP
jgi:uncharacterized delta-60 repeat protein